MFLATKVHPENLGYDDVIDSTKDSLRRLNTDYIDLLYVHWPAKAYDPEQTLKAFQKLKTEDVIRHIGVSNFEPRHLERAIEVLDEPPFANQVECHPLLPQDELRSACSEFGVELVAYSPLARGDVFDIDTISTIADEHGVSPAQVALAWLRESGVPAIPKASTEAHITDNWQSQSLELTQEQRNRINSIEDRRRFVSPPWAPWN